MEDKAKGGLQHIPTGAALSLHSTRSSIIARGRRDAANAASNPHYRQGVTDYNAAQLHRGRRPASGLPLSRAMPSRSIC